MKFEIDADSGPPRYVCTLMLQCVHSDAFSTILVSLVELVSDTISDTNSTPWTKIFSNINLSQQTVAHLKPVIIC